MKLGLPQILALVGAGLGFVNIFLGLAPAASGGGQSQSVYEAQMGWIPVLLFIGGIAALSGLVPKGSSLGILPSVISLGTVIGLLCTFSAIPEGADTGAGFIMILIFGILQTGALVVSFLFEAGIIKPPAPNPYGQGGYPQQPGQFPPPSGQFPTQQPPGQATTFAPQQGQFGQPGQPGQAPGTPPGGYPQQG